MGPETLEKLALLMQGVGTGMEAGAIGSQAKQESAYLKYNAALSELKGEEAIITGQEKQARFRKKASVLTAEQRADFAASGVLPQGTPLVFMAETVGELEKDALMFRTEAEKERRDWFKKSAIERIKAKDVRKRGRWDKATTLLSGGAKMGMFAHEMGIFKGKR